MFYKKRTDCLNLVVVPRQNMKTMIDGVGPVFPQLPLVHTMKTGSFLSIVSGDRTLRTHTCDVYDEDLIYLFYGRPAYKIFPKINNTSLPIFKPVTILFEPDAIAENDIARVMPFDSGAFKANLYGGIIDPNMPLEDFEIGDDLTAANSFVSKAFETNEHYYRGRMRADFQPGATNLPGQCYRAIVDYAGQTAVDDRRSAVEVQCSSPISINRENVMAISLPSEFLDHEPLFDFLKSELECEILNYDTYHCSPSDDIRDITVRVKMHLEAGGLL